MELEKRRREALEDAGVDVDALLGGTASEPAQATKATKTNPVHKAARTKPARTLTRELSSPGAEPRSTPMSYEERRRSAMESLVRDFQAGKLD